MVSIKIYLVDGSIMPEYKENNSILTELKKLEEQGYKNKELIDRLITDDWGVPPKSIVFKYKSKEKTILY